MGRFPTEIHDKDLINNVGSECRTVGLNGEQLFLHFLTNKPKFEENTGLINHPPPLRSNSFMPSIT